MFLTFGAKVRTSFPPLEPRAAVLLTGIEADVEVSSFIVALTSPPDARYSPLTKPPSGPGSPTDFDAVRALVIPMAPDAPGATKVTHLSVSVQLSVMYATAG